MVGSLGSLAEDGNLGLGVSMLYFVAVCKLLLRWRTGELFVILYVGFHLFDTQCVHNVHDFNINTMYNLNNCDMCVRLINVCL